MKSYTKKEVKVLSAITCDKCGLTANKDDDILEFQEFISFQHSCGFASVFEDGVVLELDMCQNCVKSYLGWLVRIRKRQGVEEN